MNFAEAMSKAETLAIAPVWQLASIVRTLKDVPGDIVECGCYKGGSTLALAASDRNKVVYAFDTFTGLPKPGEHDQHQAGEFYASVPEVSGNIAESPNIVLISGEFRDSVPAFRAKSLSLLVLDCDLYESYKVCLEHFWPMVSPGGWAVLEDYQWDDCQGARKACDEFFCHDEKIEKRFGMWVVVK